MPIFLSVTVIHFSEHIAQIIQLYFLHWNRKDSMGVLGMIYPWMMKSEMLHYGHALFMLLGLALFLPVIQGKEAFFWFKMSFIIQFWHHIEHFVLLLQAILHQNLGSFIQPVSFAQLVAQYTRSLPWEGMPFFPRIELHFFYNLIVLVPMMIGLLKQPTFRDCKQTSK